MSAVSSVEQEEQNKKKKKGCLSAGFDPGAFTRFSEFVWFFPREGSSKRFVQSIERESHPFP